MAWKRADDLRAEMGEPSLSDAIEVFADRVRHETMAVRAELAGITVLLNAARADLAHESNGLRKGSGRAKALREREEATRALALKEAALRGRLEALQWVMGEEVISWRE